MGLSENRIQPILLRDLAEPFERPCKTDLDGSKIQRECGLELPGITTHLDQFFQ